MKVWNYLVIMVTIALFLTFLGFDTMFSDVFDTIGLTYNGLTGEVTFGMVASGFYDTLFGLTGILITTAIGVALVIGFVTKQNLENFIILGFITGTIITFISVFTSIVSYAVSESLPAWVTAMVVLIYVPLTVGFAHACIEHFRGTD